MSESDNTPRSRKPLGLKRSVEAGEVKQTFSHGRTNKVVVEVKRRRKLTKPGETAGRRAGSRRRGRSGSGPRACARAAEASGQEGPCLERNPAGTGSPPAARGRGRSPAGRPRKIASARTRKPGRLPRKRSAAPKKTARRGTEAEAKPPSPRPSLRRKLRRKPHRKQAGARAGRRARRSRTDNGRPAPAPRRFTPVARPETKRPEPKKRDDKKPGRSETRGAERDDKRRGGKLTVKRALNEDEGARARSLAALKRAREKERRAHFAGQSQPREKQVRDVIVPEAITVQELANRMAEKGADLVKALFNMGMMVTVNQTIDQDTAELLVEEFGHNIKRVSESDVDIDIDRATSIPRKRCSRARRWSPSWAMSITARPACSTRCAAPTWSGARPAASPSTSAPTRSRPRAAEDHLPRYAGPRGLHRDARARCQRDRHRRAGGGRR